MSIKSWIQGRIEKDCVKSTLSYEGKGEIITEEVLLKRSKLPLVGDWGRIYPPLNEDGSWNFMNTIFGGRRNFIKLLGIMLILALLFWWVTGILGVNKEYMNGQKYIILERPAFEKFCKTQIIEAGGNEIQVGNLSVINISIIKGG